MFSTTTIASSTTMPIASTRPNSVSVLIEKPNALMTANVPTSETGMVSVGISVVRQSCRNTYDGQDDEPDGDEQGLRRPP